MHTSPGLLLSTLPYRSRVERGGGGSIVLTLYVAISLVVTMTIAQEDNLDLGSVLYWVLVLSTLLLPLVHLGSIARILATRAVPLLLFGAIGCAWHIAAGDMRAAQQLILLVWVLAWLSVDDVRLRTYDLSWLYMCLVIFGIAQWIWTDRNMWGVVPGTTEYEVSDWRVSFFPNIAATATLSLAVVFVLTRTASLARAYAIVLGVALYFLILSFVRTASIALLLYVVMRLWTWWKPRSPRAVFWAAVLLGVGTNAMIATSVYVFSYLQQFDLVSRLFLRSEAGLSADEIWAQLYRPWLWAEHLQLFLNSPGLMGLGTFNFFEVQSEELNVGTTPHGNEALPTRLLATYGLPAFLYAYYFLACLYRLACRGDYWACCCFPSIVLLLMQWGAIFHPTDSIGALFLLIALRGRQAFIVHDRRSAFLTDPSKATAR